MQCEDQVGTIVSDANSLAWWFFYALGLESCTWQASDNMMLARISDATYAFTPDHGHSRACQAALLMHVVGFVPVLHVQPRRIALAV